MRKVKNKNIFEKTTCISNAQVCKYNNNNKIKMYLLLIKYIFPPREVHLILLKLEATCKKLN